MATHLANFSSTLRFTAIVQGKISPSCQQPKLQECQSQEAEELPELNTEMPANFPKIGEQHPDGPGTSPDPKNQNDTLNFGWFSLPRASQGGASGEHRLTSPLAAGGGPDNSNDSESNQRPLSIDGLRPGSQQRTLSQQGTHPSSSGGAYQDSPRQEPQQHMGEPADGFEPEQAGFGPQGQSYSQKCRSQPLQPVYEDVVVDWPISILAKDYVLKQQNTPQPCIQPRTPMERPEIREAPPTPLPPLHWQGYQNCSRPTFTNWHDQWRHERDLHPTAGSHSGKDANNNHGGKEGNKKSGKNTNKNRGKNTKGRRGKNTNDSRDKNTNNNSDIDESLTGDECFSRNTMLGVINYSADGSNTLLSASNFSADGSSTLLSASNYSTSGSNTLLSSSNDSADNSNTLLSACIISADGSNTQFSASSYSSDGNNNNWMISSERGPSPKTQVRTLPPYGQSSETVPRFYNPSVVMKWEDADDQSNSMHEKPSFKQISLMKRIRTSFFQMWSILSCLKNQEDEAATQRSRLFKYDRFDNNKKSKSNAQGSGD